MSNTTAAPITRCPACGAIPAEAGWNVLGGPIAAIVHKPGCPNDPTQTPPPAGREQAPAAAPRPAAEQTPPPADPPRRSTGGAPFDGR